MSNIQDAAFTNIDLNNVNTNLLHQSGTGVFWIDSVHGNVKLGHTGSKLYIDSDIYAGGTVYGLTGQTGSAGSTGHIGMTGPTGLIGYTGMTGAMGNIGTPATLGYFNSSNISILDSVITPIGWNTIDSYFSQGDVGLSLDSGTHSILTNIDLLDGVFIITGELDLVLSNSGLIEIWIQPSWTADKYSYQKLYLSAGEQTATFSASLLVKSGDSFKVDIYQNTGAGLVVVENKARINIAKINTALYGPTGFTGHIGQTGYTGPIGLPGSTALASILALRSSGAQTVGNAQYLKVLFDQTDDINYGVMNLSTSVVAGGTRITNTSVGVVQINVAYQVMFSEISGTSGQNTRITYISLNDASPPPPGGGYTNIYGLVSLQGDLYGTTCQGTCLLTLQPNDFIEIYAYQNIVAILKD